MARSATANLAQLASVQANRANLMHQSAQSASVQGYTVSAPVAGRIAAISTHVGESVVSNQEVAVIVPSNSRIQAELVVAPESIGLIREGQEVKLAVDAFPFQTFGNVTGTITNLSDATVLRPGANGPSPVYLATVAIRDPWMELSGGREPLQVGMTVSARIIVSEGSLLEWLFEPLYAVMRR
jgi:membrane fusion protein